MRGVAWDRGQLARPMACEACDRLDGAMALRSAFQALSTDDDYRYMFDPYWVRAVSYRTTIRPG